MTKCLMVVDLTVLDGPHIAGLVQERLVATCHVDNRQPAHPERDARRLIRTTVVRSAMTHGIRHSEQHIRVNHLTRLTSYLHNPADAAHWRQRTGDQLMRRRLNRTDAYLTALVIGSGSGTARPRSCPAWIRSRPNKCTQKCAQFPSLRGYRSRTVSSISSSGPSPCLTRSRKPDQRLTRCSTSEAAPPESPRSLRSAGR